MSNSEETQFISKSANLNLLKENTKKNAYKPQFQSHSSDMRKIDSIAKSYYENFQKDFQNQTISQVIIFFIIIGSLDLTNFIITKFSPAK